jgi:iron complex outermembrane receptor protein
LEFLKDWFCLIVRKRCSGWNLKFGSQTHLLLSKNGGEITIQAGSYAYSIDFYGPLDKHIAYRLRGSYESKKV